MSLTALLIIFCGTYLIWFLLAAFAYVVWRERSSARRFMVFATGAGAAVLAFIVGKIAGHLWYDPLPFVEKGFTPLIAHAADNGFPSDHALLAFSLASAVAIYDRRLGLWFWIAAAVIAVARVLAGVHHVVDVVSGALIAVIAALIVYKALQHFSYEKIQKYHHS